MSVENELIWVAMIRQHLGMRTFRNEKLNIILLSLINKCFTETHQKPFVINKNTPISGSFLAAMFMQSGLIDKIPKSFYRPIDWGKVGTELTKPAYGCVVLTKKDFVERLGVVVGKTKDGLIKVIGADQGDEINISEYKLDEIQWMRWIGETPNPSLYRYDLPLLRDGVIRSKLV